MRFMKPNRLFIDRLVLGYNSNIVNKHFRKTLSTCKVDSANDTRGNTKYSDDEKTKIMNILNESGPEELSRYSISKVRLQKLLDRRKTEGDFETFDDITKVRGLGTKVLEKMCDSMLGMEEDSVKLEEKKSVHKVKGKILEPGLNELQRNSIKSVCSLSIDLSSTSWASIECDGNRVTSWDLYKYENIEAKQLKLSNTMEIVWNICENIPRSDVYVMEAVPTVHRASGADANNPKAIHINLQKVQLIAMVAAAINSLENVMTTDVSKGGYIENFILPPFAHKVFYLRPLLSARLFKIYVGKERVSPQSIVEVMLSDATSKYNNENNHTESLYSEVLQNIVPVHFSHDVKMNYLKSKSKDKELLSQTLLLAVAFMELCVSENTRAMMNLK